MTTYQGRTIASAIAVPMSGRVRANSDQSRLNAPYIAQIATGSKPTGPLVSIPRPTHAQADNVHAADGPAEAGPHRRSPEAGPHRRSPEVGLHRRSPPDAGCTERTNPYSAATMKNMTGTSVRPIRANVTNRNIVDITSAATNAARRDAISATSR